MSLSEGTLPSYPEVMLTSLDEHALLAMMERDYDMVPRNVIDHAAQRGDKMVAPVTPGASG